MMVCLLAAISLVSTVAIAAVGDVMLGRNVAKRIQKEGWSRLFDPVRSELSRATIAIGNLECVLSDAPFTVAKRHQLKADPSYANVLAKAGFDVMSVANNHALDCGIPGLRQTVRSLNRVGIEAIGDSMGPLILNSNDVTLALLAYCDFPPRTNQVGIRYTDEVNLRPDIARARKKADIVIVSWHWGDEGISKPSARQRDLAKRAALAGADLILGHHPHVPQPIEWVKGSGVKKCLVAYSLGNFIFDAVKEQERKATILHVSLNKSGVQTFRTTSWRIERGAPTTRFPALKP